MKKNHHFAIYSNDQAGILNRITAIFSRVNLNIDALSVCETERAGVFRHSVQVHCEQAVAKRLCQQLERQIDVIQARYREESEVIQLEVALYKVPTQALLRQPQAEAIMREHHASVLSMNQDFAVIQRTGQQAENHALLLALQDIGVQEFVRSGPVSVNRPAISTESHTTAVMYKQRATCDAADSRQELNTTAAMPA